MKKFILPIALLVTFADVSYGHAESGNFVVDCRHGQMELWIETQPSYADHPTIKAIMNDKGAPAPIGSLAPAAVTLKQIDLSQYLIEAVGLHGTVNLSNGQGSFWYPKAFESNETEQFSCTKQ